MSLSMYAYLSLSPYSKPLDELLLPGALEGLQVNVVHDLVHGEAGDHEKVNKSLLDLA